VRLEPVVVVQLGGGDVGAVGVGLDHAGGDGDGGAGRLAQLDALALHAVGADVDDCGVVEHLAVARDVDAVVIVAVLALVMVAGEGCGQAAEQC
jgi:hypothetical protein